jgi:hypothetical protein
LSSGGAIVTLLLFYVDFFSNDFRDYIHLLRNKLVNKNYFRLQEISIWDIEYKSEEIYDR